MLLDMATPTPRRPHRADGPHPDEGLVGVTVRPPTRADAPALLEIVHADEVAATGRVVTTRSDVEETLSPTVTTLVDDQWLAVDVHGQPAVWVALNDHGDTVFQDVEPYRHPARADEVVRYALVARALARARERAGAAGLAKAFVLTVCDVDDEVLASTLRSLGMEHRRTFHRMHLDLTDNAPKPRVVPGVVLASFDGSDHAWRDLHAVMEASFADHFGYAPMSADRFRAATEADPAPDRDLWRVATVDGQTVGAVVTSGRYAESGGGYVRELGVLPSFRGRGIGAALLTRTFADYRDRGRTWVQLSVDIENGSGAVGLYEAVGMRSDRELHAYLRDLQP
jgi:ribosomal protein S18 acetylase RimI-like enzyme